MGDKMFYTGTRNVKTARLRKLISSCGTKVIAIDEFQHFKDNVSDKVTYGVAEWLKVLVEKTSVSLVVSGLKSCESILRQDEQLLGRFMAPIIMSRFDWRIEDDRAEFIGILKAFNSEISKYFDICELHNSTISFILYIATGGLIGYLTKILTLQM